MFKKESTYLLFNNLEWYHHPLGEYCQLITLKKAEPIRKVHGAAALIEELLGNKLEDLTVAYDSIAIFTTMPAGSLISLLKEAKSKNLLDSNLSKQPAIQVPICYAFGKDLDRIAKHNNLSREKAIAIHVSGTYTAAVIGFQPGFTYAEGLDDRLFCPRKAIPDRKVLAGSIGIGGSHTGIYSFDSPGGWNIIGRTPISLFDKKQVPPIKIPIGSTFQFQRISKATFEKWQR